MSSFNTNITNPSANQILIYDEIHQTFINATPSLALFNIPDVVKDANNLGSGVNIFNDVFQNTLRFRSLIGGNGINITNLGDHVEISFDGDASTLGGLGRSDFLQTANNLSDADPVAVRTNINVYSKTESNNKFLEANASNIPDTDNAYDLGSNGFRFADIYATSFHGLASEAILARTLENKNAQDGQVLVWRDASDDWVPEYPSNTKLSSLTDVDLSNLENQSVLVFNSTRNLWESAPISTLGVTSGGSTSGSVTGAENIGTGKEVFSNLFGTTLEFKTLTAGANITIVDNFNSQELVITADVPQTTDGLTEGTTNLYYTDARVGTYLQSVSIQDLGSMPSTGPSNNQAPVWDTSTSAWVYKTIAVNLTTTDDLPEGNVNLYYTQARAYSAIDAYIVDSTKGITLEQLKDTNVTNTANTYLSYNGTNWVNNLLTVSDISDINLTGIVDGQVLAYDQTNNEFVVKTLPSKLSDLAESTSALYFNQSSFDTFFNAKTTDDLPESATNLYLNTANLKTVLGTESIGDLKDVDISTIANNQVLIWNAVQGTFLPADASSLNITVTMSLGDLTDVNATSITNATNGQVLSYNATSGLFEASSVNSTIASLSDVNITSIQNGQGLVYLNGSYINQSMVPYSTSVTPLNDYVLAYDSSISEYKAVDLSTLTSNSLVNLSDVTIAGTLTNNQIMVWDATNSDFTNKTVTDFVNLGDLKDVTLTTTNTNDVLSYNGTNWVNRFVPAMTIGPENQNDILVYDTTSSSFINKNIYSALNINYSAPTDKEVFIYNAATSVFDIRTLTLTDISNISYTASNLTNSSSYALTWNTSNNNFTLSDINTVQDLANLNDVDSSNVQNNDGIIWDAATSKYVVKPITTDYISDIDKTNITQNDALVWDATNSKFIVGEPNNKLSNLTDVVLSTIQSDQGLTWNGTDFVNKYLEYSYQQTTIDTTPLEYWNFSNVNSGNIVSTYGNGNLIPESGYSSYTLSTLGVDGTIAVGSGTDFSNPSTLNLPKALWADLGSYTASNVAYIGFDFWVNPSEVMSYSGSYKYTTTLAGFSLVGATNNDYIVVELIVKPDANDSDWKYYVTYKHKDTVVSEQEVQLSPYGFNHIVLNYSGAGSQTIISPYVNSIAITPISTTDVITTDTNFELLVVTADQVETGSKAPIVDEISIYQQQLSYPNIVKKYNHIVKNGMNPNFKSSLLSLTDVNANSITSGQILTWNGTTFIPSNFTNVSSLNTLTDVTLTSPATNEFLQYNGTDWVNSTISIPASINDLTDVTTTGITSGQVLQWNGTDFVPYTLPTSTTGVQKLSDLTDVISTLSPSDGQSLVYSASQTEWIAATVGTGSSGATQLSQLTDVDGSLAPTNGQILAYNTTNGYFMAISPQYGSTTLTGLTDVTLTSPATNEILQYNGTDWVNATISIPASINDLTDVTTTGIASGQILQWNGTNFIPYTLPASGATRLSQLTDVNSALSPLNGQVLVYNSSTGYFDNQTLTYNLNALTDVTLTTPTTNDLLQYNGTDWVNSTITIPASINDLTDVTSSGILTGQVLQWNGTTFVPYTIPVASTTLNALTDVTLTTLATNDLLQYNGTDWVNAAITIPTDLTSLTDVTLTTPATNDLLQYNGTDWVNATIDLSALSLFSVTSPTNGQVLTYNSTSGKFENTTLNVSTSLSGLTDVTLTTPATNDLLQYNGTDWVNATISIPASINDLSDVTTTGITSGQILQWNGTDFIPYTIPTIPTDLTSLTDVTLTTPATNEILQYNGTDWVNTAISIPASINDLTDVNTSGITTGQVLQWNGTDFIPYTISAIPTDLTSLTDVTLTTPTTNDLLQYNGTDWVNAAITIPASLGDLTNVDLTGLTNGQILVYNSTSGNFEPAAASSGGAIAMTDLTDFDGTVTPTNGQVVTYDSASGLYKPESLPGGYGTVRYATVRLQYDANNYISVIDNVTTGLVVEQLDNTTIAVSSTLFPNPPYSVTLYAFAGSLATYTNSTFTGGQYLYRPLDQALQTGDIINRDSATVYTKDVVFGQFNVVSTSVAGKQRFYQELSWAMTDVGASHVNAFTGDTQKFADVWILFNFGGS